MTNRELDAAFAGWTQFDFAVSATARTLQLSKEALIANFTEEEIRTFARYDSENVSPNFLTMPHVAPYVARAEKVRPTAADSFGDDFPIS